MMYKKTFMQLIYERRTMRNAFIIMLRTSQETSVQVFEKLIMDMSEPVKMISKKEYDSGKKLEAVYLMDLERFKLTDIKKQIEEKVEYDSFELFEFMNW